MGEIIITITDRKKIMKGLERALKVGIGIRRTIFVWIRMCKDLSFLRSSSCCFLLDTSHSTAS